METEIQNRSLRERELDTLAIHLALPAKIQTLPDWFRDPLELFLRSKQRNWPAKTVQRSTKQLCERMKHVGDFFIEEHGWQDWSSLSARWVDDFIDHELRRGLSPCTINWDLIYFCQLCNFLSENGYAIPRPMLRLKKLDEPKRLPRPLLGNDVFALEQTIRSAQTGDQRWFRDIRAVCDLAWFYLLWHCGLRVSEVSGLMLQDIDLEKGKLFVSNSKERKDRVIYMSQTTIDALRAYLDFSSDKQRESVFEVDGRPLAVRAIQGRLKIYGKQCGVKVSPHRLRHTFASQMLNAGMPVTSLQRYLGHEDLDTTMHYAGVSDPVLQKEYNQAIRKVDPLWQLDEYAARLKIAQERMQILTASLNEARKNAEGYLATLGEIQDLIDELRKDVS